MHIRFIVHGAALKVRLVCLQLVEHVIAHIARDGGARRQISILFVHARVQLSLIVLQVVGEPLLMLLWWWLVCVLDE